MRSNQVVVAVAALAGLAVSASAESGDYSFEVPLAAVSPVGDFPIHIETPKLLVDGTIHIALDASGRLTATADFPNRQFEFTGKFAAALGAESISLKTAGRSGARLTGTLSGTTFTGTYSDRGALSRSTGSFTIDVSTAHPLTATVTASARGGFGTIRKGSGTAKADGAAVDFSWDVRPGTTSSLLRARGASFQWTGKGEGTGSALQLSEWRATGFGATASGTGSVFAYDPVPDIALILANGDPLEAPAGTQPADLSRDVGPFLRHLFAVRGMDVETSTFLDADEDEASPGYSGMVAKLRSLRDASVTGRTYPTRIVVVGYGHGAARAHAAIRDVPDAPIAALVDLDATTCGWAAQGHDTDAIGGSPVGGFEINGAAIDLTDVAFDNVAVSLEVHSNSLCPDALSGGGEPVQYDPRIHRRPDAGIDGLYILDSHTPHEELHDVFGTTMTRVGKWLTDTVAPRMKR